MIVAYYGNIPYEYNWFIRLFKKGNPVENRPITEYDGMRDMALSMSCLGMTDKVELETGIERDKRMQTTMKKLPDYIKSHYKAK